jgi:uncharacterized protein YceH (UPF0502 family)
VPITLNATEARIIGCLLEKSLTTPEQYPLTLNSLTNACNQKTARDPVMSLQPGLVHRTLRDLQDKHLVRADENFKSRTEKFSQRFCNTRFSDLQFDPAEYAIICLLLLRGPQTPGELRARSGRLHTFADSAAVSLSLLSLENREKPLLAKLPRTPGRKDAEYMHLFYGPAAIEKLRDRQPAPPVIAPAGKARAAIDSDLLQRVQKLEAEVAELKERFDASS